MTDSSWAMAIQAVLQGLVAVVAAAITASTIRAMIKQKERLDRTTRELSEAKAFLETPINSEDSVVEIEDAKQRTKAKSRINIGNYAAMKEYWDLQSARKRLLTRSLILLAFDIAMATYSALFQTHVIILMSGAQLDLAPFVTAIFSFAAIVHIWLAYRSYTDMNAAVLPPVF